MNKDEGTDFDFSLPQELLEHNSMVDQIKFLEKKVQLMEEFLYPCEMKVVENLLNKNEKE